MEVSRTSWTRSCQPPSIIHPGHESTCHEPQLSRSLLTVALGSCPTCQVMGSGWVLGGKLAQLKICRCPCRQGVYHGLPMVTFSTQISSWDLSRGVTFSTWSMFSGMFWGTDFIKYPTWLLVFSYFGCQEQCKWHEYLSGSTNHCCPNIANHQI